MNTNYGITFLQTVSRRKTVAFAMFGFFNVIIPCIVVMMSSTWGHAINECQPCHPRPRSVNRLSLSRHMTNFLRSLASTQTLLNETLRELVSYHGREDSQEQFLSYPRLEVNPFQHGNKLVDDLESSYRVLTSVIANLTLVHYVSDSRGFPTSFHHAHFRVPLCQLWKSLASLGHDPPASACLTNIPDGVDTDRNTAVDFIYITYKRAIHTVQVIRNYFPAPRRRC